MYVVHFEQRKSEDIFTRKKKERRMRQYGSNCYSFEFYFAPGRIAIHFSSQHALFQTRASHRFQFCFAPKPWLKLLLSHTQTEAASCKNTLYSRCGWAWVICLPYWHFMFMNKNHLKREAQHNSKCSSVRIAITSFEISQKSSKHRALFVYPLKVNKSHSNVNGARERERVNCCADK